MKKASKTAVIIILLVGLVAALALAAVGLIKWLGSDRDDGDEEISEKDEKGKGGKAKESGGSYQSAVDTCEKYITAGSVSFDELAKDVFGGADDGAFAEMVKIMRKSESGKEMLEDLEDDFAEYHEALVDEYGRDVKVKIRVDGKETIDKEALEEIRDDLRDTGEELLEWVEEMDDYDEADWEALADDDDLSVSDMKKYAEAGRKLGKKLEEAKVTEGYELACTVTYSGKDDEDEEDVTLHVYKVNGCWLCWELIEFAGVGIIL
ncbi:MAG: hypothetical protein K6G17_06535 [Oscillospiraceae bacterium]|nr:hypothetical protein [Oscillospiraceae bacterium]